MCSVSDPFSTNGDWKSIPPDVREKIPRFELVYEDESAAVSASSERDADLTEEEALELAEQGLHVELLRWQDSNHVGKY